MTEKKHIASSSYSIECKNHHESEYCLSLVPHTETFPTKSSLPALTQFSPSTRLVDGCSPNEKKRILNHVVRKLEKSRLPGSEHAINHLYDKYSRNLATNTIRYSGGLILRFLDFLSVLGKCSLNDISRKDIAAYVEHKQDCGLKIVSIRGQLATIYAFLQFLVDNKILPPEILYKKINIKLPQALPRAIPIDDLKRLLAAIDNVRERALILLLLHTGMRIGELLNTKMKDIILSERKIMISIGEKNLEGRVVYFSHDANKALKQWLSIRKPNKDYLFYGTTRDDLSYVRAWMIMRNCLEKAGLNHKGYSLHSLRHTFATNMLNAGLRLEVLQQILGHKCIEMTLRYARMSNATRESEYFNAMAKIEKGGSYDCSRTNSKLQAVFEKKKLHRPNH